MSSQVNHIELLQKSLRFTLVNIFQKILQSKEHFQAHICGYHHPNAKPDKDTTQKNKFTRQYKQ